MHAYKYSNLESDTNSSIYFVNKWFKSNNLFLIKYEVILFDIYKQSKTFSILCMSSVYTVHEYKFYISNIPVCNRMKLERTYSLKYLGVIFVITYNLKTYYLLIFSLKNVM